MRYLSCCLICMIVIFSCKEKKKDYVEIKRTEASNKNEQISIESKKYSYKKVLFENKKSRFVDTLSIKSGIYTLNIGDERIKIYLKNEYELEFNLKGDNLDSITYSGIGSLQNNYLVQSEILNKKFYKDTSIFNLDRVAFENQLKGYGEKLDGLLRKNKVQDTILIKDNKNKIASLKRYLNTIYDKKEYVRTVLAKGATAPSFDNFENYNGNTNSLEDYKGKYVYIDVWATWCMPCLKEFPALKKIKKQFKNRNIEFVGISIDEPKQYEVWRQIVEKYEIKENQLFMGRDTVFQQAYRINAIPRFLLIDPVGKIVSGDAPRPSNTKLKEILDKIIN